MSETEALLAEFDQDPEAGLKKIMDRFEKPLVRHARAVLLDTELAKDVVQETFIRFLTEKPRPDNLGGWLYRVSRNLALDIVRKEKRRMRLNEGLDERHEASPETTATLRVDLGRAYTKLTPEQREVVFLKVQEGLSYKEIADTIGKPAGTVGWMLHEALKILATELRPAVTAGVRS
jgi:RNA polymerase sigma factor (sigma-70 family)